MCSRLANSSSECFLGLNLRVARISNSCVWLCILTIRFSQWARVKFCSYRKKHIWFVFRVNLPFWNFFGGGEDWGKVNKRSNATRNIKLKNPRWEIFGTLQAIYAMLSRYFSVQFVRCVWITDFTARQDICRHIWAQFSRKWVARVEWISAAMEVVIRP